MQTKYSCSQSQGDAKSCSLTYKTSAPMWAYARQNVKHDSRNKHMVDGNVVIRPWGAKLMSMNGPKISIWIAL